MAALKIPTKTSGLPEVLWTVEDVAKFLRRDKKYVYGLIHAELIPYIKLPTLGEERHRYAFDPIVIYKWVKGYEKMNQREDGEQEAV